MSSKTKKLSVDDPMDDFDLDFTPDAAASKLPVDITNGIKPLSSFMEIPVEQLTPYTQKKQSDFEEWPQDKFEILVSSVKEKGILEAITVRPLKDSDGMFEILAGEHRWKAAKEAGLKTIPAHVMRDCDDDLAESIFSLTNVLRRDNSIRDRINGWWHYLETIRYKSKSKLEQMKEEGIIKEEIYEKAEELGQKAIYRLAKLHDLIDPLIDLIEQRHLSASAAYQYSFLTPSQQEDLLPFKDKISNADKATELKRLAAGDISGKEWTIENVEEILTRKADVEQNSLSGVGKMLTSLIRKRIPKAYYAQAPKIVENALDEYLQNHPEYQIPNK